MPPAPPSPKPAACVPYGEQRWTDGETPTDFTFTGQRGDGFGLLDFNARYYDAYLNRFVSPDSIVPDYANPQSLNRYSYVLGNPLRYTDPTGHCGGPLEDNMDPNVGDDFCGGGSGGGGGGLSSRGGNTGTGKGISSRGGQGSQSSINSADEIDDLVGQAQRAQKEAEFLHQKHQLGDKTVAVSGNGTRTLSGWKDKDPNFASVDIDDVLVKGSEINHTFPRAGGLDQGRPGQFFASHAEKKMSVLSPNQPVGIAGNAVCTNCQSYFRKLAVNSGQIQVVADRQVTRIFHPDGSMSLAFPD